MAGRKYCMLTGSGTTALYLILKALARLSPPGRSEVIMPDYTAPSLVLALKAAGTVPALSDVSLETFNQDMRKMGDDMGAGTLAVMPVHMYGLAEDLAPLEEAARRSGTFVIEDAASAMGSAASGRKAGSMGDVSFYSFNRGKNLSTVSGGAVLTDRDDIHEAVAEEAARLDSRGGGASLHLVMKAIGLSLIWRPFLYTLLSPLANGYRYHGLHEKISLTSYTEFQAGIGSALMTRREEIFEKRHRNGLFLHGSLSGLAHLRLPALREDSYPVFNQYPVLVSASRREEILGRLRKVGIEATTLYPWPIHRIYDHGRNSNDGFFPGAEQIAEGILLLPVHPGVRRQDLLRAAGILREAC
jgi:dTDP-4-amino-4,6-dideoxygalactose transaminase